MHHGLYNEQNTIKNFKSTNHIDEIADLSAHILCEVYKPVSIVCFMIL